MDDDVRVVVVLPLPREVVELEEEVEELPVVLELVVTFETLRNMAA